MLSTPIKAQSYRLRLLLALFLLLISGALILAQWRGSEAESIEPATLSQTPQFDGKLEVELITLRPSGFEPLGITRPKGPFVLVVDDRSGKGNSALRLQPINGESLRDIGTNRMKSEWHEVIDLAPGDYDLVDYNNPKLRCRITILQQ